VVRVVVRAGRERGTLRYKDKRKDRDKLVAEFVNDEDEKRNRSCDGRDGVD
jgi:hypothetical protein